MRTEFNRVMQKHRISIQLSGSKEDGKCTEQSLRDIASQCGYNKRGQGNLSGLLKAVGDLPPAQKAALIEVLKAMLSSS